MTINEYLKYVLKCWRPVYRVTWKDNISTIRNMLKIVHKRKQSYNLHIIFYSVNNNITIVQLSFTITWSGCRSTKYNFFIEWNNFVAQFYDARGTTIFYELWSADGYRIIKNYVKFTRHTRNRGRRKPTVFSTSIYSRTVINFFFHSAISDRHTNIFYI